MTLEQLRFGVKVATLAFLFMSLGMALGVACAL